MYVLSWVGCRQFFCHSLFPSINKEPLYGRGATASCKQNATLPALKAGIYKDTSKITNITYNFRDILNLK